MNRVAFGYGEYKDMLSEPRKNPNFCHDDQKFDFDFFNKIAAIHK